jgi:hypothetical protein
VKPDFNSVEVHPQLGHNRHPVDGASDFFGGEFLPIFWKKEYFVINSPFFESFFFCQKQN